ncbi:MAG: hypothetical protein VYD19_03585 [Myxococcota bacterium]|nr:hypothetical protein [Myxococcota bacterium]
MSTSLLCLLFLALWTVGIIIFGVSAYRISAVFSGARKSDAFLRAKAHGGPLYSGIFQQCREPARPWCRRDR